MSFKSAIKRFFQGEAKAPQQHDPITDITIEGEDEWSTTDQWTWQCEQRGCKASGTGSELDIRHQSMLHLLNTGHSVTGHKL